MSSGDARLAAFRLAIRDDDRCELGIMLARGLRIMLEHVPQHQRVRHAMRQMMQAAERVGEGVHARDRRVGEGEARQMRPEQHRLARLQVLRLGAGGEEIGRQQPQRLAGRARRTAGSSACAEV